MKKNNSSWYNDANRQAPVAILMIIFSVLKSIVRNWWPIILILVFRSEVLTPQLAKEILAVIGIFVIIVSIWRYYRFFFYISDDKLHVHSGIFRTVKLDIPFERIQSISFEQNLIHRIFKSVRIKLDTAGSSSEEFEFTAIDLNKAEELRNFILSRKSEDDDVEVEGQEITSKGHLLLQLSNQDLLKVGVSQNHLRTTGIIIAFLLGLRDRIKESVGDRYVQEFDTITEKIWQNWISYGVALFLLILVLSFFGTLIYTFFRYYNLNLWKTRDGYRVESGLLNRHEQAARDQKIQIVRWVTNPIRDYFEIVQLRFFQASSAEGTSKTSMHLPGVPKTRLKEILDKYFSRITVWEDIEHFNIDRRFFIRRFLFVVFIPGLIFPAISFFTDQMSWFLVFFLWLAIGWVFQHFLQKKWHYRINSYSIITTQGVIERVNKALLLYKVQAVQISQSPFQKRRDLCNLILHSASGDIVVPYINFELALRFKNYVLYKAESSREEWM